MQIISPEVERWARQCLDEEEQRTQLRIDSAQFVHEFVHKSEDFEEWMRVGDLQYGQIVE